MNTWAAYLMMLSVLTGLVIAATAELIPLEATHKATLLDAHNDARCVVGVADLLWDDADEASAAEWAANCVYEHSASDQRGGRGENIAAAMGQGFPAVLSGANAGWIDQERPNWPCESGQIPNCDPVPGATNAQCGHYTQVVWDATTSMGCAHALCTDNNPFAQGGEWRFTVCQFSPAGNMMGARPFPVEQCEGASICVAAEVAAADAAAAAQGVAAATAPGSDSKTEPDDPDDETSTILLVCIIAVVLAAVSAGTVHIVRRRRGQDAIFGNSVDGTADGDEDLETWGEIMFTELDADGSGALDKQEMRKACAQRGLVVNTAFIDGLWDVLDEDGSGDLQLEEFKKALTIVAKKSSSACGRATSNPGNGVPARTPSTIEQRSTATVIKRAPPDLSLVERESSSGVTPPDSSRLATQPATSPPKTKLPPPPLDNIVKDRKRPPPQLPQQRRSDLVLPSRRSRPQPTLPT